jgi:hypothetical protein
MKREKSLLRRREFIKKFAGNTVLLSASSVIANSAHKMSHGRDLTKDELESLSSSYNNLDTRTRWMVRGMFVLLGIDILLFV